MNLKEYIQKVIAEVESVNGQVPVEFDVGISMKLTNPDKNIYQLLVQGHSTNRIKFTLRPSEQEK